MVNPTPQQLRALEDLRNNREITDYLQSCLEDLRNRLVMVVTEEDFRVLQGQAQSYQKLLSQIEGTTNRGKR